LNDLGDDRKEMDGRMGKDVMKKARKRYFEIGRMMRKKYSTRRCSGGQRRGRQRQRLELCLPLGREDGGGGLQGRPEAWELKKALAGGTLARINNNFLVG
jgi:hypothetical protein